MGDRLAEVKCFKDDEKVDSLVDPGKKDFVASGRTEAITSEPCDRTLGTISASPLFREHVMKSPQDKSWIRILSEFEQYCRKYQSDANSYAVLLGKELLRHLTSGSYRNLDEACFLIKAYVDYETDKAKGKTRQ